jgi:hypothetical protein
MSSHNPEPGKTLKEVTVEVVKSFCNSDELSRVMLGKTAYLSFKVSGVRIHEQERLLLCNLKECVLSF